jgi:hypothetical protein
MGRTPPWADGLNLWKAMFFDGIQDKETILINEYGLYFFVRVSGRMLPADGG